jgi:hypothetical protein
MKLVTYKGSDDGRTTRVRIGAHIFVPGQEVEVSDRDAKTAKDWSGHTFTIKDPEPPTGS